MLVKVNKSVLKIGKIQEEVLGNSSGDVGENNDKIINKLGDKYKHERQ